MLNFLLKVIAMRLPFTVEQFLQLFKNYNETFFPIQVFFYFLAATIIYCSLKKIKGSDKIINLFLAFLWMWMGIVYHLLFFTAINKAAYLFGSFFIMQGMLIFYFGVVRLKLTYAINTNTPGMAGIIIVAFALLVYPLLGYLFGHVYPTTPTFGVPCPTVIFTFGVLLWSSSRVPNILLIIPFLWALIGFAAATTLGMWEDMALLVAALITTLILLSRKHQLQSA